MTDKPSEMVERVARALAVQRVYEGYNAETRARMIEREMYGGRRDARIAIAAMAEPTEEMIEALPSRCAGDELSPAEVYRFMITAALKEG